MILPLSKCVSILWPVANLKIHSTIVIYDSGVVLTRKSPILRVEIYERRMFIRLATDRCPILIAGDEGLRWHRPDDHRQRWLCVTLRFGKFFRSGNPHRHLEQHGKRDRSRQDASLRNYWRENRFKIICFGLRPLGFAPPLIVSICIVLCSIFVPRTSR